MTNTSMKRAAKRGALLILTIASAFGTGSAGAQCPPGRDEIALNGRRVPVPHGTSLMDLVRSEPRARRLESLSNLPDDVPVVVLNGVLTTGGLSILRQISVDDVDSLTILVPQDAVMRYGSLAGRGAVVLTTRMGQTRREASAQSRVCGKEDR
jgi:hypothetical protein